VYEGRTLGVLRRGWLTVLGFMLVGSIIGSVYAVTATPSYVAESEVFVNALGADNTTDLAQGSNYTQQQARNYRVLVNRQLVLEPVVTALQLPVTPGQLSDHVTATVPLNTSIISISVSDSSPDRAAAIANAVATSLTNVVGRLAPKRSDGTSPVQLAVVQRADVPGSRDAPNSPLALIAGLAAGLVAGLAFVLARELLTSRLTRTDQISRALGVGVVASLSTDKRAAAQPVSLAGPGSPARAEEFRGLRAATTDLTEGSGRHVIALVSSVPREGTTLTALNFASSLALAGTSTCLVEADLRRPELGTYLGLDQRAGLTDVLAGRVTLAEALGSTPSVEPLALLLAGTPGDHPAELLSSKPMHALLDQLAGRFDVVVVDCPSLGPVADAAIIARRSSATLLVVGCGRTKIAEAQAALALLRGAGAPVAGAVVNFAGRSSGRRHAQAAASAQARAATPDWEMSTSGR